MAASSTLPSEPPPLNHPGQNGGSGWLSSWLPSWRPTSEDQLCDAEKKILDTLSSEYRDLYVPIGEGAVIRCLVMEPQEPSLPEKIPLVLIHGFGCGIVQFFKNLDHLHRDRRLYALDLPGFARSTRIPFPEEAEAVEAVFVSALERWREGVGLERFVLLGHSLGGFLSLSYSMTHPHRVRHLILDDPWGFPERSEEPHSPPPPSSRPSPSSPPHSRMTIWARIGGVFLSKFNPFAPVRAAGPLGPYLLSSFRRDLTQRFGEDFMTYVYHCVAQNPTGETAFYHMQIPIGWAKRPMIKRIAPPNLSSSVPLTFVYGARSWMDSSTGERVQELRPHSYVQVHYVRRAGHHVHADQPEAFNSVVREVCCLVDRNEDTQPCPHSVPDFGNGINPDQPN